MIRNCMVGLYSALIFLLCFWGLAYLLTVFCPHTFSHDSLLALSGVIALAFWLPGNHALTVQWGILRPN